MVTYPRGSEVGLLNTATALELPNLSEDTMLHAARAVLTDEIVDVAHVKKSSSISTTR